MVSKYRVTPRRDQHKRPQDEWKEDGPGSLPLSWNSSLGLLFLGPVRYPNILMYSFSHKTFRVSGFHGLLENTLTGKIKHLSLLNADNVCHPTGHPVGSHRMAHMTASPQVCSQE